MNRIFRKRNELYLNPMIEKELQEGVVNAMVDVSKYQK